MAVAQKETHGAEERQCGRRASPLCDHYHFHHLTRPEKIYFREHRLCKNLLITDNCEMNYKYSQHLLLLPNTLQAATSMQPRSREALRTCGWEWITSKKQNSPSISATTEGLCQSQGWLLCTHSLVLLAPHFSLIYDFLFLSDFLLDYIRRGTLLNLFYVLKLTNHKACSISGSR